MTFTCLAVPAGVIEFEARAIVVTGTGQAVVI